MGLEYYAMGFDEADFATPPQSQKRSEPGRATRESAEVNTDKSLDKRCRVDDEAGSPGWKDSATGNIHADSASMDGFVDEMLETSAAKNWHHFYKRNQDKFYKDRHYLHHAFPGICNVPPSESEDGATAETESVAVGSRAAKEPQTTTLLGFGCGVGNALFPLAKMDPNLRIIGLDFATEAIRLFRTHPMHDDHRIRGFVQDLVNDPFVPEVALEAGRIDKVLCLFCLSAVRPDRMQIVVQKAWDALRPGGTFFFRDYTRGDHAQVRFGTSKKISDNFYMRQDGTRVREIAVVYRPCRKGHQLASGRFMTCFLFGSV